MPVVLAGGVVELHGHDDVIDAVELGQVVVPRSAAAAPVVASQGEERPVVDDQGVVGDLGHPVAHQQVPDLFLVGFVVRRHAVAGMVQAASQVVGPTTPSTARCFSAWNCRHTR